MLFAAVSEAKSKKPPREHHDAWGFITLNGERTKVHWTDGDSFNIKDGVHNGKGTRLQGYNTLEAYGPVHSWGKWTAAELYEVARDSASAAAAQEWKCTTDGKEDGYHRLLIDCPDLAVHMVHEGYGMAYAVEGTKTSPAVLEAQKDAQTNKRGMWLKGVSKCIVSSLHSVGEEDSEQKDHAYNRVVDTRTGEALKRAHKDTYETCQKVCETVDGDEACMVYVPFKRRYHDQPDCLVIKAE
ncbi:MAG: thermonuclease family protein [Myxococcaceae bacterium]